MSAIVIQGPHYGDYTRTVIREFLHRNKDVHIIVSTYESDKDKLDKWEKCLANVEYIFAKSPPETNTEFWQTNYANQNLQRLTSYIGLKRAKELGFRYSLKIRSDVFLGMREVLRHLRELVDMFPVFNDGKMNSRLIVSSHATFSDPEVEKYFAPFHIRDHWCFGETEEVIRYYNIESPTWNGGRGIATSSPESNMTLVWMRDLNIDCTTTAELLGKYFIVEDYERVEQCRTYDPKNNQLWCVNPQAYEEYGITALVEHMSNLENRNHLTRHGQWLKMLRT